MYVERSQKVVPIGYNTMTISMPIMTVKSVKAESDPYFNN